MVESKEEKKIVIIDPKTQTIKKIYNTKEEIDVMVEAIKKAKTMLS